MIAILEKTEHNIDFHEIVEFLTASHIRHALTICPTFYVSHIRQFWSTARIETTNQKTKILYTVDGKSQTISESSLRRHLKLSDEEGISSLPDCLSPKSTGFNEFSSNIATAVVCLATNMVYNFSKMIFDGMVRNINNELASLSRDDRQGKAFPTVSSLDAGQDRENINKTSTLPHESLPRVTSLDADEGSMQQRIHELMELCTSLQRQQSQMAAKIKDQDLEIYGLKARVKSLEDKERRSAEPTKEDAPITGGIMKIWEELGTEKSTELGSNDTEEMVNVLSSMKAANILTSGVAAASVSPAADVSAAGVPSVSGSFPTVNAIFTTANVVTPYLRRPRGITIRGAQHMRSPIIGAKDKGKQKVVELKDSEIAGLHAEEELKMMIDGLDRSNEVIAKHLQEYEQAAGDLSVGEKIELISELLKYQDHRTKILKYQAQQSKPLSNKEQREFYMSVLRSHGGWKTKHFRRMTMEQLEEKFIHVKHPIIDWEIHSEGKREYWKIIRLGGHTAVYQFFVDMLKQFDREDLHQLWTLVKETFSIRQATKDKEKELWVELKRLFKPDFEDQLWTHN
nr:hypothetical protein [Tanacetum cinerariifolium]